jgi:hypothetical protein
VKEDQADATQKLQRLRGVTWEWRDNLPEEIRAGPGMGVIAQEIEKVFPDLVVTGEDGVKRVVYEGLIGPLIEAVKELDNRLHAIEQQLQAE